jgi:pyruvate/2-oxoglutarate dehydrogenase complex dihydrolipoamide dehydrogenase (E3) component
VCLHVPALATVGLTQSAAEERGIPFRVEVNNMQNWLSGRTYAETAAWAKVLIDPELIGEVVRVLDRLARDGTTMVLVTH